MMRPFFPNCRNALAFLSRLAPPVSHEPGALAAAVPLFPLAGLVIGALAALPALTLPPAASWLSALAYVLLMAWITRGLHWDGLADLADACGSNAEGERFWEIMKDSRIGAFGVMALVFGILAQVIAARHCIARGAYAALILAPALARASIIVLGRLRPPAPHSTLAALVLPGVHTRPALASLTLTAAAAFIPLGPGVTFTALALAAPCILIIARIGAKHGGINGDFLGTAILAVEICTLIAAGW